MRLAASTLAGILVCLASGLAAAEGVDWVAKGTSATLIPAGRDAQGMTLHLCRVNRDAGAVVLGKFWTAGADAWQCHVGTDGKEQVFAEFDMLVQASKAEVTYKWVPGHATSYPQHSVVAGQVDKEGGRWLACARVFLNERASGPSAIRSLPCIISRAASAGLPIMARPIS